MRGQWLGSLAGEAPGHVMLDLDERSDRFTGTALFTPFDPGAPSTVAFVDTATKEDEAQFEAPIFPVNERNRGLMSQADLAAAHPDVLHDEEATINLRLSEGHLLVSFLTNVSSGQGSLLQRKPEPVSAYTPNSPVTWEEFKSKVAKLPADDFVWRGQSEPWSLQSSFHRTGRVDMRRYVYEDIPRLQAALLPHTKTFLDLTSPVLSGGLYNLAQHHGFPTPLLDWTYSPYVASFFAFRTKPDRLNASDGAARIFAFDRAAWPQSLDSIAHLSFARPHVTMMDLPALENQRSLPQQAVAMITNVQNIEEFVRIQEHPHGKPFLLAFDIPYSERTKAMRDLRTMGITAGSMFPGLDGTCEELRHRLFD